MTQYLPDEAATSDFGRRFLQHLPEDLTGWTVLLKGELGAGKSTFARAVIRAAGHKGPVPSPTYTLVEPYTLPRITIYHIDLYRVASEDELHYLGWNELDDGFRLVEWPDRTPGLADEADVAVMLSYDGEGRSVDLEGLSPRGSALVRAISAS